LLPLTDAESIRDEIDLARAAAESEPPEPDEPFDDTPYGDTELGDADEPDGEPQARHVRPSAPPSVQEVRAGFARIAAKLTA
jgi:hypothetical protein